MMTASAALTEKAPYPARNVQDETKRLLRVHPEALDVLNHYGFAGAEDFTRPFRILALDEGSGDSVIFLAEQLRGKPSKLIYLSASPRATQQVKARAELRKLTNIEWVTGEPASLAALKLGEFDYISCMIPLGSAAMPEAMLESLRAALTETGICLCMASGYYGRTGQRQMRDLVTQISGEAASTAEKLQDAKKAINALPATNWYIRTKHLFESEITQNGDDALQRLFIHDEPRHYTVPALYQLIENKKLFLLNFVTLEGDANVRYVPETTLTSPTLQHYLSELSRADREAAAEILYGTLTNHYCYISRAERPRITPRDTQLVPFYAAHFTFPNVYAAIAHHLHHAAEPVIEQQHTGHAIRVARSNYTVALCQMMDGKRSIAEIIALILAAPNLPAEANEALLLDEFERLYQSFHLFDWMLLRAKHVTDFPTVDILQK